MPGAVRPLRTEQVFHAFVHALTGAVAAGEQAQHGPGGLRRVAFSGRKHAIVVAGAAFAPSAVGVLNGAQPLSGAQHVDFTIVFTGGAQSAQRETGPVNIGHAPAPVPASIGLLRAHPIIDAPPPSTLIP